MKVKLLLHSWFRELADTSESIFDVPPGTTIHELHREACARFPKLRTVERSTLIAVGVEYQGREHVLAEGDEVSFFPPVQGG